VDQQAARRVRIADVAEAAGVSKTAVSFAFNNPDRLAPATSARILAVADTLGYRPDPVARMLTQRRTGTIGLVTPQALASMFSNPYFGMFSAGVAAVAESAGYGLHFISPLHGSLSSAVARATVDGIVVIGLSSDHPEIAEIRRAGLPTVTVDSDRFEGLPAIDVDDEGGARQAAAHLAALGHRRRRHRRSPAPRLPGGTAGRRGGDRRRGRSREPRDVRRRHGRGRTRLAGRPPPDGDPRDE
jgi:alanine racemase